MGSGSDFVSITGQAVTPSNVRQWQRRAGLWGEYVDGICGPMTIAAIRNHLARQGQAKPVTPAVGEVVFTRGRMAMIRQRREDGSIAYDCEVAWIDSAGVVQRRPCSTMPMQTTSKASPLGLVAVVRPGLYEAVRATHKKAPALRFVGDIPCWRNRAGWPFISSGDVDWSERLAGAAGCPQIDERGTYATDILFHPGPPHGYSIGCMTADRETVEAIVEAMPARGIVVRVVEEWVP